MLDFSRILSSEKASPYDSVTWEVTPVRIITEDGRVIYECLSAEFPSTWSPAARNICASKYFRESRNTQERETSLKTTIERVVSTITRAGIEQKYFTKETAEVFGDELRMILLTQRAAFASPIWFNLGIPGGPEKPILSACFINSVEDNLHSILELVHTEGLIYASGGGSGVNFSKLRASHEPTKGGGKASGPLSWMTIYNAAAGVIQSGGRTRRAAKMCLLNIDHPDIESYVESKSEQEGLVEMLVTAGMSPKFDDPKGAYSAAKFQNENHSVRISDDYMTQIRDVLHSYQEDFSWNLTNRTDGKVAKTVSGKELFNKIAQAIHRCGDPGVQFHDTINRGNTCSNDGEIHSCNPCAEFTWHDDSACNLASLNLDRFLLPDRSFDIKLFRHTIRILVTAQDLIVDLAGYPTEKIAQSTLKYRPLGLGFTNLGGMLLSLGIAYSSEAGRDIAASVACLMTAQAYLTSAELAEVKGPFPRFSDNRIPMEEVLGRHVSAARALKKDRLNVYIKALTVFREAVSLGFGKKQSDEGTGYRNAQVTLVPPAGTVSLMMDACTTGLEPPYALKVYKQLVGGSTISTFNPNVEKALIALGYEDPLRGELLVYCAENGHFEGSQLKESDLPCFDCSIPIKTRYLSIDAHLEMVAAISPHISGAASKTFNLPHGASPHEITITLLKAWERGIKGVAIYRENSKLSSPLRVKELIAEKKKEITAIREELPNDRASHTHKLSIMGYSAYLTVGMYTDGRPGEIFLRMAKPGSLVSGLLDSWATAISFLLQYGVPLEVLVRRFEGTKFSPMGVTDNPNILFTTSIVSYVFTWLKQRFLSPDKQKEVDEHHKKKVEAAISASPESDTADYYDLSSDPCTQCGSAMVRTGTCSVCTVCGNSSGVCS